MSVNRKELFPIYQDTNITRRGFKRYAQNPSIIPDNIQVNKKPMKIPNSDTGIVILDNDSGEVLGTGIRSFVEFEEVDAERFVKIFLEGMKKASGLTKAGMQVFEFIYQEIMGHHNQDKISISWFYLKSKGLTLQQRTYDRGIHELLEKEFIFETLINDTYFINIRYMFNGDRIAFVKGYTVKKSLNKKKVSP